MQLFGRMNLMKKLLIGPGAIIILMLIMAMLSFQGLSSEKKALSDIYQNNFKDYQTIAQISEELGTVSGNINKLLNWINIKSNQTRVDELAKSQNRILSANIERLEQFSRKTGRSAEETQNIKGLIEKAKVFQQAALTVIDMSAADANSAAMMASGDLEEKYKILNQAMVEVLSAQDKMGQNSFTVSEQSYKRTIWIFFLVLAAAIILAIGLNLYLARSISSTVKEVSDTVSAIAQGDLTQEVPVHTNDEIGDLAQGINDMRLKFSNAVGESVALSQSLAEGASEQAASIEETSASLEEMSSMTKQNAQNSQEADKLIMATNGLIEKTGVSMENLTVSMKEIAEASERTQKIVKTIDEIAFQTNLLALNAAVEAARAGEAGAGFAVVADEVRSLALRSATAAHDTSALIQDTVKRVHGGVSVATTANNDFKEAAAKSRKVQELVAEITVASGEQAQGIEQINTAVAEMDKVIQQTAAGSEELASNMAMFKTDSARKQISGPQKYKQLSAA
jgi:methyl-accepting chemotaxis protein